MARLKLRILINLFLVKTLFIQTNEQKSIVKASNDPIKAERGSDVILPCHLKPPVDVSRLLVEWKRGPQRVHLCLRGHDIKDDQDPWFKDRTQLFHQEMKHGNISLKLFNVTKEDEGNYTCSVPWLGSEVRKGFVTLIIEEPGINKGHKEENKDKNDSKGLGSGGNAAIAIGLIIVLIIGLIGFTLGAFVGIYRRAHRQKANQMI